MNTAQAPAWLPAKLVPFFTLSYPTAPPLHPDSFLESNYYGTGLLDGWLIITAIAIMAVLRDVTRVFLMEPFARWKLRRDLQSRKRKKLALANGNGKANGHSNGKANGFANGNGHAAPEYVVTPAERRRMNRSVIRFAEQGWSVVYYVLEWFFGLVRPLLAHPNPHFSAPPACAPSPEPLAGSNYCIVLTSRRACPHAPDFELCSTYTATCPRQF